MAYSWKVRPVTEVEEQEETPAEYAGPSVDVVFERAPKYQIVLEERASGTEGGGAGEEAPVIRSSDVEVFCKYVRREIRSLFDDERDQVFDAMKVRAWFGVTYLYWCSCWLGFELYLLPTLVFFPLPCRHFFFFHTF